MKDVENTAKEIIEMIQEYVIFAEAKVEILKEHSLNPLSWEGRVKCAQSLVSEINDRYFKEEE